MGMFYVRLGANRGESRHLSGTSLMSDSPFAILQFLADIDDDKLYLSKSTTQHQLFVLRVLSPNTTTRVPDSLQILTQLGDSLQTLQHPNIKPVVGHTYQDDRPALVMPYYEGHSAADELANGQPMAVERVVQIALQIADALDTAHQAKIYHGGVRPTSVILGVRDTVHLCEWGTTLLLSPNWQTIPYIAPELKRGDAPNTHSDVWSLGAVMFYLLTAKHPAPHHDLKTLRPDCPTSLVDLIERLLAPDPYARPYHAALVGKLLERERPLHERTRFTPNYPAMPALPLLATRFFGRAAEIQQLLHWLYAPEQRLISLCGPAGSGRTTLALQTAHDLLAYPVPHGAWHPDEIYLVRFEPDLRPEHFIVSLTLANGAPFEYRLDVLQQLIDFLSGRRALLILDDYDLFDAGRVWLSAIIYDIPTVKALVISESPMELDDEVTLTLSGLGLPTDADDHDAPTLRLFEYAARRRDPTFALTPDNTPDIVRLCRRVGGAPLSIVLAAGGQGDMDAAALTAHISDALNVSATSDLNIARIRAAFEAVWGLITPEERAILTRLTIIRGDISPEAAQTLGRATPVQLHGLVRRSLLSRQPETGYYSLHPLVHRCVQAWFKAETSSQQIWHDHSAYYLRVLVREGRRTTGTDQREAARFITANLDNIRPAWAWAIENQHFEAIDEAAEPLYAFLVFTLRLDEGDVWYAPAVAALKATSFSPRRDCMMAALLFYHAILSRHDVNRAKALALLEQAESLSRAGWTLRVNVLALNARGLYESYFGNSELAKATLEQMLTLALYEYNPRSEMIASLFLGAAQYQRTIPDRIALERGKTLLKRALELCEQSGDVFSAGVVYLHLGMIHAVSKDPQTALNFLKKGWQAAKSVNNPRTLVPILNGIIELATEHGNHKEADAAIHELTMLSQTYAHPWAVAVAITNLALLEMLAGNYAEANQLCLTLLHRLQHDPRTHAARVKARCIYAYGLASLGDSDGAMTQVRVALDDLDPDDPTEMAEVWAWLAVITYWTAPSGEAMVVFETVLQRYDISLSSHHKALLLAAYANSAIRLGMNDVAQVHIDKMLTALHDVVSYDFRGSALLNLFNPRLFTTIVMAMWFYHIGEIENGRARVHSIIPLALQTRSPHMMLQVLGVGSLLIFSDYPQQALTWMQAIATHPKAPEPFRQRGIEIFKRLKQDVAPRMVLTAESRAPRVELTAALNELRDLL